MKKPSSERYSLPVIHNCAAGIDIGSRFHVVAVPADITKEPVQTFKAFTADLEGGTASVNANASTNLAARILGRAEVNYHLRATCL